MNYRVLATARSFCRTEGPHHAYLAQHGCKVDLRAEEQPLSADKLADIIAGYDGVILGLDSCDASVLARADRLRVISRYGVGVDNVDLAAATRLGIAVTITPGTNTTAVAELTIALILALARSLPQVASAAKAGQWRRSAGWELSGKTLGLIGFGAIGQAVAKRAHGLELKVLAYDPFWPSEVDQAERVDLATLLSSADIVSLHAALTPDTRGLINRERLAQMKDGAILVNTARAALVDEEAFYEALTRGKLAGAAIDVLANEASPLLGLENVIVTPHLGATTREAVARMSLLAAENLVAVLHGKPCRYLVTAVEGSNGA
ncbi:MAG: phosphoglycerate dehydrogenase [Truepera sp.]|nr:phosphoglycerate dehydrogenase [Truepera sp.]